jgi:hypothetical protein
VTRVDFVNVFVEIEIVEPFEREADLAALAAVGAARAAISAKASDLRMTKGYGIRG